MTHAKRLVNSLHIFNKQNHHILILWISILPVTLHKHTYQAHERIAHHSVILWQIRLLHRCHTVKIDIIAIVLYSLCQWLLYALLHALLHTLLHALLYALRKTLRNTLWHVLRIG